MTPDDRYWKLGKVDSFWFPWKSLWCPKLGKWFIFGIKINFFQIFSLHLFVSCSSDGIHEKYVFLKGGKWVRCWKQRSFVPSYLFSYKTTFNPFVPNAPFLYPLKASEVFWCFHGVEQGCIGNEWVEEATKM